jgi:hypothetical protein
MLFVLQKEIFNLSTGILAIVDQSASFTIFFLGTTG